MPRRRPGAQLCRSRTLHHRPRQLRLRRLHVHVPDAGVRPSHAAARPLPPHCGGADLLSAAHGICGELLPGRAVARGGVGVVLLLRHRLHLRLHLRLHDRGEAVHAAQRLVRGHRGQEGHVSLEAGDRDVLLHVARLPGRLGALGAHRNEPALRGRRPDPALHLRPHRQVGVRLRARALSLILRQEDVRDGRRPAPRRGRRHRGGAGERDPRA
mmetsp:Transcript_6689/g.15732  ORF Transcript_6689/g.15732 Transcript_6689/m.15732 type:complete len:213 (-) Transcript_6689:725-1363(-)